MPQMKFLCLLTLICTVGFNIREKLLFFLNRFSYKMVCLIYVCINFNAIYKKKEM